MKILLPAAAALLLAGCAFPVVNTDLPAGWKSAQRYGTGTHMVAPYDSTAKYMPAEEVKEMQRDRFGSREPGTTR
jgi:hypothetical protein